MKVLVFTQPLGPNYGGILQAYALKTVLERSGHTVDFLDWYSIARPVGFVNKIKQLVRTVATYRLTRFVDANFTKKYVKTWDSSVVAGYDAVVVGSDQVWRPRYNRNVISHAFCDYCAKDNVTKISYAASFGVEVSEFSEEQSKYFSELLKSFRAVSVREKVGIELCKSIFDVKAVQVLDPALLLDREDYMALAGITDGESPRGGLLAYVLDETDTVTRLIETISAEKGLKVFRNNSRFESKGAMPWERIQPSLENWIRSFYDADFIVTDSFHACVFSLLFGKPFIVVGNKERGMSRFTTLLDLFSSQKNLVQSVEEFDNKSDYRAEESLFNNALSEWRQVSLNFLKAIDA